MSLTQKIELLPVLLNGKLFTVDASGMFAITTDGTAVRLEDQERSQSRFK